MKKCKCGKEATITMGFGAKYISLCEACWKRGVTALLRAKPKGKAG